MSVDQGPGTEPDKASAATAIVPASTAMSSETPAGDTPTAMDDLSDRFAGRALHYYQTVPIEEEYYEDHLLPLVGNDAQARLANHSREMRAINLDGPTITEYESPTAIAHTDRPAITQVARTISPPGDGTAPSQDVELPDSENQEQTERVPRLTTRTPPLPITYQAPSGRRDPAPRFRSPEGSSTDPYRPTAPPAISRDLPPEVTPAPMLKAPRLRPDSGIRPLSEQAGPASSKAPTPEGCSPKRHQVDGSKTTADTSLPNSSDSQEKTTSAKEAPEWGKTSRGRAGRARERSKGAAAAAKGGAVHRPMTARLKQFGRRGTASASPSRPISKTEGATEEGAAPEGRRARLAQPLRLGPVRARSLSYRAQKKRQEAARTHRMKLRTAGPASPALTTPTRQPKKRKKLQKQ